MLGQVSYSARMESHTCLTGDAFVDDDLQVCADGGLEGTVALVCLLGDDSCIGSAGVKDEPMEAEVGEECGVEPSWAAITLDNDPPSFHRCRVWK
jgi:hypothetical protein